jgi:hypothetical protein
MSVINMRRIFFIVIPHNDNINYTLKAQPMLVNQINQ